MHFSKAWITELLNKELEENLLLQDIVYEELIEESYQWWVQSIVLCINSTQIYRQSTVYRLVDQYEKELAYYATKDPNEVIAVCPICQVSELKMANQMLVCACGVNFKYQHSIEHFCAQMQNNVVLHENKCSSRLLFFLEPNALGEVKLNAMCIQCDYYNEIVNC